MIILLLNPMMGKYEQLVPVARGETVAALKAFVEQERVPSYSDGDCNMAGGPLVKCFRKGGPLEFFNTLDRDDCLQNAGTAEDWARDAVEAYNNQILSLPLK